MIDCVYLGKNSLLDWSSPCQVGKGTIELSHQHQGEDKTNNYAQNTSAVLNA